MSLQDTIDQINNLDINDIDWSRVGVWPLVARAFIWMLAFCAILVGAYFLFVKDMQVQLEREQGNEASLKKDFQERALQAATLSQYQELMRKIEKDFEVLVGQLPKKTQVPELLDNVDEKGRESGLDIVSIKLQPEVVGDVYVELPIEIIVKGSYHDFGTFISSVAGMPRIVTLHNFDISADKDSETTLLMTIMAKTYRYLSPDEAVQ